ncbi:putative signal peptidase complex catalytic subunit SEC11 [Xylaria sp. FL0043]|nr:putative signal peptidase complex catalytic subunit SEC11 [Xylaria sp. FL0043]
MDTSRSSPSLAVAGWSIRKALVLCSAVMDVLLPLSTTFMLWKGLSIATNSSYPLVCVVSESMAPTFHRGDLLLLWNWTTSVEPGDIPVVWFYGAPLPMVHRIIQTMQDTSGLQSFLTKGDNNIVDDVALYPGQRTSVYRSEVVGFVRGYVPYMGWFVIAFQDFYWMKYGVGILIVVILLLAGL